MIHQSPSKGIRVREKLLTNGPKNLSDIELLAAFISSGSKARSCMQLAQDMLHQAGDLRALLNLDVKHFCSIAGIGVVRFVQLQALLEIYRRSDFIHLQKEMKLTSPQQTYSFLKRRLRDKKNETFVALFLDNQHRILAYDELFTGTIDAASIHPRPIIERTLQLNAAALIFAHNHPSGLCDASSQDIAVTERLKNALSLIDARLLDHLVVGDNEVYSIMNAMKWNCH